MPGRLGRAVFARLSLPAALLAASLAGAVPAARAQQPAPSGAPPTTEQLRQAIEEIRRRLARPGEAQPPAEQTLAAELKAANARIAELSEALAKLRGERDGLRAELEAARAEGERLEQVVRELDGRAQGLEQRLAELAEGRTREVQRLEAELAAARKEIETAARAASGGEQRAKALEAEGERLRAQAAELEKALAEARGQAAAGEKALVEARAQTTAVEKALVEARERVASTEKALAEARAQASDGEKALAEARERAEQTARRLAERESELAGLVGRLGELEGELQTTREKARGDAQAAARRIEELTAKLAEAGSTVARLEGEVLELRSIAATSVGELQNLGEQLLRVLADNQALLQTVEQVRTARELALAEAAAARRDAELYAAEAARLRSQLGGGERPVAAIAPAAAPARLEPAADGLVAPEPALEPLPRAQLAELRAVEGPDGTVVTVVEGTAFQFGSEQLTEAASGALLRVGRLIDLVRPERVRFVGHTDAQGDEAANRRLSLRRAQAVRDWLVRNRGLDTERTRVEGRGPDQPIASNDTPEGRRANRRVEVILERKGVAR